MIKHEFQVTRGKIRSLGECQRCQQPFQEGQIYVSRHHNGHRKYYHKTCWESMFYDFPDDEKKKIRK